MPQDLPALAHDLRAYALSLPSAWEDHPWGDQVYKVNKKIFAFLQLHDDDTSLGMSLKLPASGPALLEQPWAKPTGYGLGRAGWVSMRFTADTAPELATIRAWVAESYRTVAPKRLGAQVG